MAAVGGRGVLSRSDTLAGSRFDHETIYGSNARTPMINDLMKLVSMIFLLATAVALADGAPAQSPPNIVFLLSDDHSVPDLGCYGNRALKTPVLDQLARNGMMFTRAYVTSPQCSPSRASVFTGRSAHAVGASRKSQ